MNCFKTKTTWKHYKANRTLRVRVMKWTPKTQCLYGLQANLFKHWQRFGNISGITHWITEYFNNRKPYWFSEMRLKVGKVFCVCNEIIICLVLACLWRLLWDNRWVPLKVKLYAIVRMYPAPDNYTAIGHIRFLWFLPVPDEQPVPAMHGTYQNMVE